MLVFEGQADMEKIKKVPLIRDHMGNVLVQPLIEQISAQGF